MGLSTERKVFIALVGIAGLALVVDRGFLSPGDASAAGPQPAADDASAAQSPVAAAASIKPAAAVLIERLRSRVQPPSDARASLGASFSLASLIEPGGAGIDLSALEQPQAGMLQTTPPVLAPSSAPDLPTLSSVMPASRGGGAVLGGKLLMVGQTGPGGYKLIEVKARGVLVEKDGRRYTIEIPITGGA